MVPWLFRVFVKAVDTTMQNKFNQSPDIFYRSSCIQRPRIWLQNRPS